MGRSVRAKVLLVEAEALGLSIQDLVSAAGREVMVGRLVRRA